MNPTIESYITELKAALPVGYTATSIEVADSKITMTIINAANNSYRHTIGTNFVIQAGAMVGPLARDMAKSIIWKMG